MGELSGSAGLIPLAIDIPPKPQMRLLASHGGYSGFRNDGPKGR
jgi:hypothetical protein